LNSKRGRLLPADKLREYEIYAYQAAYYVVQNEKLAVEVAGMALLDVLTACADDASESLDKNRLKRAVVTRLIPIVCRPARESRTT